MTEYNQAPAQGVTPPFVRASELSKPKFDVFLGNDILCMQIANDLAEPLKDLGFKPVFIFSNYKYPKEFKHPLLADMAFHGRLLNEVVLPHLDRGLAPHGSAYLTPERLKAVPGVKVLEEDSMNDPNFVGYVANPANRVGMGVVFRLYEKLQKPLIDAFEGIEIQTAFRGADANDTGKRKGFLFNIHPAMNDKRGVIPPFRTMQEIQRAVKAAGKDPAKLSSAEQLDIARQAGVDTAQPAMTHRVDEEFDTGPIVAIRRNPVEFDMKKSMWENYMGMKDFIVAQILDLAKRYKNGEDLSGTPQPRTGPGIHYNTWPSDQELDEFQAGGGTLVDIKHTLREILGDASLQAQGHKHGFAIPGTATHRVLDQRLKEALKDRDAMEGRNRGAAGPVRHTPSTPAGGGIVPGGNDGDQPSAPAA